MALILKSNETNQLEDISDEQSNGDFIDPFFDFEAMLDIYYANVYHARAVRLKAKMLSNTIETDISSHIDVPQKEFLYSFILDLEIYGNAFLEKAGTSSSFMLYNLMSKNARINSQREIFNYVNAETKRLEGYHLKYTSPRSRLYGEPDYLSSLGQIRTTQKADIYNNAFFDNGAKPDFAVIYEGATPDDKQQEAFKDFFSASYKGANNAHKSMVLWSNSDSEKPVKIRLERLQEIKDLSFESLKKINRDEIITSHGIPPRLVGVMSAGGLGGGKELIDQMHLFEQTVLLDKRELIEEFFNTIGLKVKIKPLDTTNFKDDASLITNLVNAQILDIGTARDLLGY